MQAERETLAQRIVASYDVCMQWLEQLGARQYWEWKVALVLVGSMLFFSLPSWDLYWEPNGLVTNNWDALEAQFRHPLTPLHADPDAHYGQIGFRLLLPVISYVTGVGVPFWLVVQPLAGVLFLVLLLKLLTRATEEAATAMVMVAGMAFIYTGKAFYVDVVGYFDGMAMLLILLAMWSKGLLLPMTMSLMAFFVDERAIMAVPTVVLWQQYVGGVALMPFGKKWKLSSAGVGIGISVIIYLIMRYLIGREFGLGAEVGSTPLLGLETLRTNYATMPLLLLTGIEFYWVAVGAVVVYAWRKGGAGRGILVFAYLGAAVFASLLSLDVTRSIAYLFPAVVLGMVMVVKEEGLQIGRGFAAGLLVLAILFPPIFSVGNMHLWMGPALPKIAKWIWSYTMGGGI